VMKIDRRGVAAKAKVMLEREDADTSYTDAGLDTETLKWVQDELRRGNGWAWCDVKVTACIFGLRAETYLGQCSYESRDDFKKCDYYESLVNEVIELLVHQLQAIADDHALWEHDRVVCIECAVNT
jgi:hypothetical protein